MTHWFPPREFATKMAVWNSSHSIGAGVIIDPVRLSRADRLAAVLLRAGGDRAGRRRCARSFTLRDTPESLGLPPVEGTADMQHDIEPLCAIAAAAGVHQPLHLAAVVCQFLRLRRALRHSRLGADVFETSPRHRSVETPRGSSPRSKVRDCWACCPAAGSPIACSAAGPRGPASST